MKKTTLIVLFTIFLQGTSMFGSFPGLLCAIEGIDGAGKTTLIKSLRTELEKLQIQSIDSKEPGGTELGQHIRDFLANRTAPTCLKAESLLFAADRAQHFHDIVIPHLKKGFVVLSDRMADSSLAYQGFLKGLDLNMIKMINDWCMESIQPDIVIYLKIDPRSALERIKVSRGVMTSFEEEYQDRMHILMEGFERLLSYKQNVIVIDALQTPEQIVKQTLQAIKKVLDAKNYVSQSTNTTQLSSLD